MKVQSLEYQDMGTVELIGKQKVTPFYECASVDDLLRVYPNSITRKMAISLFLLGYIEGKRTERSRKKKTE